MTDIPRRAAQRTAKLASLPLGVAGRVAAGWGRRLTGQDAEVQSVESILAKEQTSTVFKDTRELAKVTVNMVDAVLSGKQPEVNDTKTYENGVKTVPSYLLKPVSVDASNWKEVLVGSGYYKESQIQ